MFASVSPSGFARPGPRIMQQGNCPGQQLSGIPVASVCPSGFARPGPNRMQQGSYPSWQLSGVPGAPGKDSCAFVQKSRNCSYDDGEVDDHTELSVWLFPGGIAVGNIANYYSFLEKKCGNSKYGSVDTDTKELLAEGVVASVKGNTVTFSWNRGAAQENGVWHVEMPPPVTLDKTCFGEPGLRDSAPENKCRIHTSHENFAEARPWYDIKVPDTAWQVLRQQPSGITGAPNFGGLNQLADFNVPDMSSKISLQACNAVGFPCRRTPASDGIPMEAIPSRRILREPGVAEVLPMPSLRTPAGQLLSPDIEVPNASRQLQAGDAERFRDVLFSTSILRQ